MKSQNKVIDLFSGCGGLALGFLQEGYSIASGIEINKAAAYTASYNLHWKYGYNKEHLNIDITKHQANIFNELLDDSPIIIGGPPCQAYSIIGRAKLRSLGIGNDEKEDERAFLYEDFLRFALSMDAKAIVMENVPESTNFKGKNIPDIVCDILSKKNYTCFWTLLNSADFGTPQTRERIFVIAVKKEITEEIDLPVPTHQPRSTYIRKKRLFKDAIYYREALEPTESLPYWITVEEALSDLPSLFPTPSSKYSLFKLNMALHYKKEPQNEYQRKMRANVFPSHLVTGHAYRKTLRDFPIFNLMKPGDEYPQAHIIANELFTTEIERLKLIEGSLEYHELKKKMVPPYSTEKFLSKWKKLYLDRPSHTLVAHLSVDTYSHIHPWEPRGISVREAARLQSFPDDFIFNCSMSDAYRQIGNAVPPLLSQAIAKSLKPYLFKEFE